MIQRQWIREKEREQKIIVNSWCTRDLNWCNRMRSRDKETMNHIRRARERLHRMRMHIQYLFMEINYPSFVLVYANDNNDQTKNKRSRDQWNLKLSFRICFHERQAFFFLNICCFCCCCFWLCCVFMFACVRHHNRYTDHRMQANQL